MARNESARVREVREYYKDALRAILAYVEEREYELVESTAYDALNEDGPIPSSKR